MKHPEDALKILSIYNYVMVWLLWSVAHVASMVKYFRKLSWLTDPICNSTQYM